jgi:hypothetical protein
MRTLLPSCFAGLAAIALLTGLPYLFNPRGDTHIGYWIYIFTFAVLFVCHLLGVAVMFGTLRWRQSSHQRIMVLPLSFVLVLASYVLGFMFIVRLAFGFWVWQASISLFVPCLIVGGISASIFVFSSRIHGAQPSSGPNRR